MKKLFTTAIIFLLALSMTAQPTQEWVQSYAGGSLATWNMGIALDNSGNVYVAGKHFDGTVNSMLLQKYDVAGNLVWTENYLPAGSTDARARAMVMDSNGDLIVSGVIGNSPHIGFTRKYNQDGQLIWSQSTNFSNYSLTTDETNSVYVTSIDVSQGNMQTIKYDAAGILQWTATNNITTGGGNAKIFYKAGFLYRTGSAWVTISAKSFVAIYTIKYNASTGSQVWAKTWYHADKIGQGGNDLVVDAGGNVFVSGHVNIKAGKNQNLNWVTLKYNSAGTQQWVTFYDGNGNDYFDPRTNFSTGFDSPVDMTMDNSGNIIVAGKSYTATGQFTSHDMTTIKYSSAGSQLWVRTYDDPAHGNNEARAITTDASSNVYITGHVDGTTIKYNSTGTLQWTMNYNGASTGNVNIDNSGNVYVAGIISGSSLLIKYSQGGGPITRREIIPEEKINQLRLYPNPVINQITIRNSENKMLGNIIIYDASGKMVYQKVVGSSQTVIDVQRFVAGVYYVRTDQSVSALKFIKQ